jgi:methyl-accepting chemotaxis protein
LKELQQMFGRLKVGTKLIGGFLLVAALCAFVGTFGVIRLRNTDNAYGTAISANTANLTAVAELNASFLQFSVDILRAYSLDSPETRAELRHSFQESDQRLRNSMAAYAKTIDADPAEFIDQDRRLFGDISQTVRNYESEVSEPLQEALGRNDRSRAAQIVAQGSKISDELQKQIGVLTELNVRLTKTIAERLSAAATSAVYVMVGVLVLVVFLAAGIGIASTTSIIRPLKWIQEAAEQIARGDASQEIACQSSDEIGALANSLRGVSAMLKDRAAVAERIAAGDIKTTIAIASERDLLGKGLTQCLSTLNELTGEIARMSREHEVGDIDAEIDDGKFHGVYRDVAHGINAMVAAHLSVKKKAMACIGEFGRGNFDAPMEKLPGKKAFVNDTIEEVRGNLKRLATDTVVMATAANTGQLSVRADAGSHQGDFRRIVEGLNRTFDELRKPLDVATEILEKFSHGQTPETITEEYKGEYNKLKEATNRMIALAHHRQKDIAMLLQAGTDGHLEVRAEVTKYEGGNRALFEGINGMLDAILLPIAEGNRVLCQIRGGNLRERVEIDCKGDHQKMKDAVNGVHEWLTGLVDYVTRIANGDITARMHKSSDQDQIHEWLVLLRTNITRLQSDLVRLISAAKQGDLVTRGDPEQFKGAYADVLQSVNEMSEVFRSTMEKVGQMSQPLTQAAAELNRVAQEMGSSAEQTASQANMASAGSEQVSRNIQTVATAADEMGASIKEIAKNTADATKVATAAVHSAQDTNVTISKLGQSSAEIGQVIKVITSIAQQTNLLALNATIEAARAGEAGKGFAVVANEVKELAKETAKATEDISRKIEAIQSDTKGAVSAIEQIGSVIDQINDIQNTVASAVEEQSVTTNEITRNLTEAAKGGVDISQSISGVAEAARQGASSVVQTQKSAESLERMAEELERLMAGFRYKSAGEYGAPRNGLAPFQRESASASVH